MWPSTPRNAPTSSCVTLATATPPPAGSSRTSESRTTPPPWEWHVGQLHLRSACHWLIGRALSHWSSVPWASRGKCNSCGRPCGAPAVRARAKTGICFLLLPTSTSKVHVHCTHEILVVCALCFYMWSFCRFYMWQNLVECRSYPTVSSARICHLCTIGLASSNDQLSKLFTHYIGV